MPRQEKRGQQEQKLSAKNVADTTIPIVPDTTTNVCQGACTWAGFVVHWPPW